MTIPNGYDPITLNHWLWYKYQCHEGSANNFQRLFENIIKRAKPEFIQIRPYGNIGDRKCDGLFLSPESSTVFQVYSPDELKQAEVQKKIDEDLDGAVSHWGEDLKKWVFVYNVRRGLPPDIPSTLLKKQSEYPNVELGHLSSDAVWEMARALTLQQRVEVLGAPSGYEHLFISSPDPSTLQNLSNRSRLLFIQDSLIAIDKLSVLKALEPDLPFGFPIVIRPKLENLSWSQAAEYQKQVVLEALSMSQDISLARFAVFSLTPIPLAIHLGFLLSDGVQVRHFQYDRDRLSWQWPELSAPQTKSDQIYYTGIPEKTIIEEVDVLIRVSLSAKISRSQTDRSIASIPIEIDICVDDPDVKWLVSPSQLTELSKVFRKVLKHIRNDIPNCSRIHLFCAAPTGACIVIGQSINPRMNPPVELYQFSKQAEKPYKSTLILTENCI